MKKPEFVQIDEVKSDIVHQFDRLTFPEWVDRSKIGVNVQEIEKICRIACMHTLTVCDSDKPVFDYNSSASPIEESNFAPYIYEIVNQMRKSKLYTSVLNNLSRNYVGTEFKSYPSSARLEPLISTHNATVGLDMEFLGEMSDGDIQMLLQSVNREINHALKILGAEAGIAGHNLEGTLAYLVSMYLGGSIPGPYGFLTPIIATAAYYYYLQEIQKKNPRFAPLLGLLGVEIERVIYLTFMRSKQLIGVIDS